MTATPATTPARRRRLAIAAAATLAATAWVAMRGDDEATSSSAASATRDVATSSRPHAPTAAPAPTWPEPPREDTRPPWRDAFAQGVAAWGPPPPPPAPPPAPPPPPAAAARAQAPAFAYAPIGRLDDGVPRVLFSNRKRSFGAKAADVIDGAWRVDAIGADSVTLTWLPGDLHQTLPLPSAS